MSKKGMKGNMYYQNYEDYMRSILGYPIRQNYMDTYESCNSCIPTDYTIQTPRYSEEIMDLYPEIYKILNPMVCKICEANTKPINRELIEKMTDEIYLNIESDPNLVENDVINVRVNLPKESTTGNNISTPKIKSTTSTAATSSTSKRVRDNRNEKAQNRSEASSVISNNENRENRQFRRNNTLRDLIRILILNRLLGRDIRPPRPRPPRPPRPPYPGGPGPNPRPPIQPRDLPANQWDINKNF